MIKILLDLGPLVAFMATYYFGGIMPATAVFMGATLAAALTSYFLWKKVSPLMVFSGLFVLLFGSLTLFLHDSTFIKIKPTLYYLLVSGLLGGGLLFRRLLLKDVMDLAMQMTDEGWRLLTIRTATFFLFMAMLNEFVWRVFSEETWVWTKLAVFFPLTFLFIMSQTPMMMRHEIKDDPAAGDENSGGASTGPDLTSNRPSPEQ